MQMNQIQSELHLARKLIAERDSEVQRIRTTNNQVLFTHHMSDGFFTLSLNKCFIF